VNQAPAPPSGRQLLSIAWHSLTNLSPMNSRLILLLAILLFLTDLGYEGQRSPDQILALIPLSVASIAVFFAFYLVFSVLAQKIESSSARGVAQFFIVVFAEVLKSAFLIFFFRPDIFLNHFLARLPGDVTIAALYWLVAAVILTTANDHALAVSELNRASDRLQHQRNLTLKTATDVEQQLHDKASSVLLKDLDRLANLSREIMDSAKASEVKLDIQRLVRNQVRPLSRELRSRVEVLENQDPVKASQARLGNIRSIPRQDASYIVSYLVAIPNIGLTILTKSDVSTALVLLLVSLSVPLLGNLSQRILPNRKLSSVKSLALAGLVSILCSLPFGVAMSLFVERWPALGVTVFTSGGVLLLCCLMATSWFALQRERREIIQQMLKVQGEAQHDLDLLDQSVWVAQRKWSYLIHGTVQAALTVAASRLELSRRPDEKLRVLVESDINRAKQALTDPPDFSRASAELLKEIAETWEGVCSVSYQIAPSAEQALNQSPTSTICFIEIVKELVSNASRHGGATKFWLNAYLNPEGDLSLIAGNNGKPAPSDISAGLGFQMITDLTKNWAIDRKAAGFSANLPLPRVTTSF